MKISWNWFSLAVGNVQFQQIYTHPRTQSKGCTIHGRYNIYIYIQIIGRIEYKTQNREINFLYSSLSLQTRKVEATTRCVHSDMFARCRLYIGVSVCVCKCMYAFASQCHFKRNSTLALQRLTNLPSLIYKFPPFEKICAGDKFTTNINININNKSKYARG